MAAESTRRVPVLLLPLAWLWRLLGLVLRLVGRIVCALLGFSLMVAGVALAMSVIGAPAGIPLSVLGLLLLVRALF